MNPGPGSRPCAAVSGRHPRRHRRGSRRRARRPRSWSASPRWSSPSTASRRTSSTTTDVLLWWGHEDHPGVDDVVVERVHRAVLGGMGLLVLHSAHYSKIFRRLMGDDVLAAVAQRRRPRGRVDVAPGIRSPPACPTRSSSSSRRCTASTSTSPCPTSSSSCRRSRAARSSAPGATWTPRQRSRLLLLAGRPGVPGLPAAPASAACSRTPCAGPLPPAAMSRSTRRLHQRGAFWT